MNYLTTLSMLAALTLIGACSLDPKDNGDTDAGTGTSTSTGTGETGAPTGSEATSSSGTTEDPTGEATTGAVEEPCTPGPGCAACSEPQNGVGEIDFTVSITPDPGFDVPVNLDAACTIEQRLSSDIADGLVLGCMVDGSPVELQIEYLNGQLLLPNSVVVGMLVTARYVEIENEARNYALVVRDPADDHVILAGHKGPEVVPFETGVGPLVDFWAPFQVEAVATACASMPGQCESLVHRGGLRFSVAGEQAVLLGNSLAKLGGYGVHVGDVIVAVSVDNMCDGGTDTSHDFLIVHKPA